MDILRRNTDYAVRAMVHLARHWNNGSVATRRLADEEGISYQLACKLMQRLHKAGLVSSSMGPRGGFGLGRKPADINLGQVVAAIQGPLTVNRCVWGIDVCRRQKTCPVSKKLIELQEHLDNYLQSITLEELLHSRNPGKKATSGGHKRAKR